MPGPRPKPTALKTLHGNPGKRALNPREPKPAGNLAGPPDWLTDQQKDGWRYAMEHSPLGLLKRIDRSALVAWVVAEDLHRQAATEQAKITLLVKASKADNAPLVQSPFLPIINRQALIMLKAAGELGFTPASRPRLSGGLAPSGLQDGTGRPNPGETFEEGSLDALLASRPNLVN